MLNSSFYSIHTNNGGKPREKENVNILISSLYCLHTNNGGKPREKECQHVKLIPLLFTYK